MSVTGAKSEAAADDVLDTLVKQFTDPLACLRELIQNAVDAGSDVVEVNFAREGELGILEVQDHGEGMDKAIIESKLVRLFASSKDGDLSKIGKFGIGFVSVFALDPIAVCVDTARAGERWRIVFHPDRTWTRAALHEPMEGTRVRLFLRHDPAAWQVFRRDAEAAVRKWCRYLDTEIIVDGITINEPLSLTGCTVTAERDDGEGTTIVVGVGADVEIGFYNKGLTLMQASSWDDLPAGVSVRLSSRFLEHTLTRDAVVKDAHYRKAIALARAVVDEDLEPRCIEAMSALGPEERSPILHWLAGRASQQVRSQDVLVDVTGRRWAPDSLTSPPCVVVEGSPSAARVAAAVAAGGQVVLPLGSAIDRDRAALARLVGCDVEALVDVEDAWVAALPIEPDRRPRVERLTEATTQLFAASGINIVVSAAVVIGRECRSRLAWHLAMPAASDTGAPPRASIAAPQALPTTPIHARHSLLVIDVDHEEIEPVLALAASDTPMAALILARLLLPMPISKEYNSALATAAWSIRTPGAAR